MKEKALTHLQKPSANRVLALLLCVATLFGMMPTNALAAANESEIVSGVSDPDPSEYTVDIGTELASVGLPADLEITITGEENESSVRTEPVEWVGDYNKDMAGEYTLTAAFTDETLVFSPMPAVRIIVSEAAASEPQDLLPAAGPLGAPQGASDEEPPQLLRDGDVNQGIVCTLTPKKSAYKTGEMIQFNLDTQFANPSTGTAPASVKFGIPLPATTPALSLPMFNSLGTESGYEDVPMCTLSFQGASTNLYLVTRGDGSRRIEYTIYPGDTIHGTLSMYLPNGISEPVNTFTVTPEILPAGDFTNAQLSGGTTSVQAQFGWNGVVKTGSTDNLGVIGAATKNPDSITYTITADSLSSGLSTGRIFTDKYVLTDTISMTGLHYTDGALTQSGSGGVSSFFVGGVKVLEIPQPLSSLRVTKRASRGEIDSFTIVYSHSNA
ncbi:MAG: hypothetical protein PHC80_09225, partial [Eubacteriales bacterium]|nr:hypothetical protein [Eubacteriales bacterium]